MDGVIWFGLECVYIDTNPSYASNWWSLTCRNLCNLLLPTPYRAWDHSSIINSSHLSSKCAQGRNLRTSSQVIVGIDSLCERVILLQSEARGSDMLDWVLHTSMTAYILTLTFIIVCIYLFWPCGAKYSCDGWRGAWAVDSYLDVHYKPERDRRIFFCAYFTPASRTEDTRLLHGTCANINEDAGAEPVLLHSGVLESRGMVDGKTCLDGLNHGFSSRSKIFWGW